MSAKRVDLGEAPVPASLALQILEEIDLGLLVVGEGARGSGAYYANSAARALLSARGAINHDLVGLIARTTVEAGPAPEHGSFSPAVRIAIPGDGCVFARAKTLAGVEGARLIAFSAGRLRETELSDVLRRRFALTLRECQVVHLMRLGLRNAEIARRLDLALGTVKVYAHRAFSALGVRNRAELVALVDSLSTGECAVEPAPEGGDRQRDQDLAQRR